MLRLGELIEHLYPSITVFIADLNLCHMGANHFLVIAAPVFFALRDQQILFQYERGNLRIMLLEFEKYGAKSIQNSVLVKVPRKTPSTCPASTKHGPEPEISNESTNKKKELTPHLCSNAEQCDDALCQILMEIDGWSKEPVKNGKIPSPTNKAGVSSTSAQNFCELRSNFLISDHDSTSTARAPSTADTLVTNVFGDQ